LIYITKQSPHVLRSLTGTNVTSQLTRDTPSTNHKRYCFERQIGRSILDSVHLQIARQRHKVTLVLNIPEDSSPKLRE